MVLKMKQQVLLIKEMFIKIKIKIGFKFRTILRTVCIMNLIHGLQVKINLKH